jgi:hypothetical protein
MKHDATKTHGGSGDVAAPFLTTTLDGGDGSASRPVRLTPGKSPWYPLDRRLLVQYMMNYFDIKQEVPRKTNRLLSIRYYTDRIENDA